MADETAGLDLSAKQMAVLALKKVQARLDAALRRAREPIAIVGGACRFPGARNPEELWALLGEGRHGIVEVPPDRWDVDAFFDPDPDAPGKMYTRVGGFVEGVDRFDARLFGITAREAKSMDPQQRMLLEVAWEALERAGCAPDALRGSHTGTWVGISTNDYARLTMASGDPTRIDPFSGSGSVASVAAGRIAYTFGLQGPAVALDTACSSSLTAVHLAVQSLRSGECDLALAGGVSLMLTPEPTIYFCRTRMMAADGRCKTFDAAADGYVRGEGCGLLVLKRRSDALASGDRILGFIRGTAVNQDGRSNGLTAPNAEAQEAVVRAALANAGLQPADVDYVEAHGTGTALGDPIEVQALAAVFVGRKEPLRIGSIKTNIGHAEAAAGVAGLFKVLLALEHGELPPHLNLSRLNPYVDWDRLPLSVPTRKTSWAAGRRPRVGGVSSFGFSGTNAHVVVEEAPPTEDAPGSWQRPRHMLAVSAADPAALGALAGGYASSLSGGSELADVAYSAHRGRAWLPHRLAVVGGSSAESASLLAAFARGESRPGLVTGTAAQAPTVAFLFPGQGAQTVGMARALRAGQPVFREAFTRVAALLNPHLPRPLEEVLYGSGDAAALRQTGFAQPALFAVELALAELWRSWGITPAWAMGHSVGELAAACVAGALAWEDGARLVVERARLMQELPPGGAMAAVFTDAARVHAALATHGGRAVIAAYNGDHVVVSGDDAAVGQVAAAFVKASVRVQPLAVSHAFHSPRMEPMLASLARVADLLPARVPWAGLVSNLTGAPVSDEMARPGYWSRQVRDPVRFSEGVATLREKGCDAFVEIGPGTTLLSMAQASLGASPGGTLWLPSLRRGKDDWQQLLESLAALAVRGAAVDWAGFDRDTGHRLTPVPTYCFQRQRYWVEPVASPRPVHAAHPLLGERAELADGGIRYEARLGPAAPALLGDHRVRGEAVLPAAAYLEMALGARVNGTTAVEEVVFATPLRLPEGGVTVQTLVRGEEFTVFSRGEGWTAHARGRLREAELPAAEPLGAVRARCREERGVDAFYDALHARGLEYGPALRAVVQVWRGQGEALARLRPVDGAAEGYALYPPLLDAGFQLLSLAADGGTGAFLPFALDRLRLGAGRPGWAHARLTPEADGAGFRADVALYAEDGQPVATVEGLRARRLETRGQVSGWLYQVTWRPRARPSRDVPAFHLPSPSALAEALARQVPALTADPALAVERLVESHLDEMSAAYTRRALDALGWTPGGSAPACVGVDRQRLLERVMALASTGPLPPDPRPRLDALTGEHPAFATHLALLGRCGDALAGVLRGETDPLPLLFPGGRLDDLEALYRDTPRARVFNTLVARAVAAAVGDRPAGRPLRILELGAGTGSTTRAVLAALSGQPVEYVFTDVSPIFLSAARDSLSGHGGVELRLLDVEKAAAAQGFGEEAYDVVLAANVLHATRDLRETLAHAAGLVVDGGLLLLLETTAAPRWADMVFGLTPGWWSFTDVALRPDHPLLPAERWLSLLRERGFEAAAMPSGALSDQAVLVARAPARAKRSDGPGWLVVSDETATAAALRARLKERGERVALATPAAAASRVAGEPWRGVVRIADPDPLRWDDLEPDCAGLLALAQATSACAVPPRLWYVSRGARPVAGRSAEGALPQAAAWGLARVVAAELPGLRCTAVDLDPEPSADETLALVEELLAEDVEDQVAFRGRERFVARLAPADESVAAPPAGPHRLAVGRRGTLESVTLSAFSPAPPAEAEVTVRVAAAALNFRDVLDALGLYPGDAGPLGGECAGVVEAVGPGVSGLAVGDEVVALAPGSLATHVTVRAELVVRKPPGLDFAEAAAAPIALLTAHHALHDVARVRPGDRVLIHAAAGGVGLAALGLARELGAEVLATAGSPEKRAYLRAQGVRDVADSRSTDFADAIAAATVGEGVDVVLGSFTDEMLQASARVLRAGGRLVDMGKATLSPPLGLSYARFDLGEVFRLEPGRLKPLLERLLFERAAAQHPRLPLRRFPLADAAAAFRHMAQARHVGKLVLVDDVPPVRPDATYLITGGLGGLGLAVARWLVGHGARHLVLVARRAPGEAAQAVLAELAAAEVEVVVEQADIADGMAAAHIFDRLRARPPLRGVVHAAGILDDALLGEQRWDRFAAVLAPKVEGGWHLHRLSRGRPLDFFVLFSSTAALLGPPGQASHAAANAFLDALAHHRLAAGLPATSVNWGAWAEIGSALGPQVEAELRRFGMQRIPPAAGLEAFALVLARRPAQIAVLPVDWPRLLAGLPAGRVPPLLSDLARPATDERHSTPGRRERMAQAPAAGDRARLLLELQSRVARVLGLPEGEVIDPARPLRELGIDSLLAVELRNELSKSLDRSLPATLLFDYPTLDSLLDHLVGEPAAPVAPAPTPAAAENAVAIVGFGCRFPGGVRDGESFWRLLKGGVDAIDIVPPDRWDLEQWYDPEPATPGKMSTRWGGFIDGVDRFDAAFFGISPREAMSMDPQQRLLLEVAWEALERANVPPDSLLGRDAGVFVGICSNDYARLLFGDAARIDTYGATGNAMSVAAGRVAYLLGLSGPAISIDTACSSSLVAVHLATQSLLRGECSLALAGGVHLVLSPLSTVALSQMRMMAPDGRCKSFDAAADGFVRGEGCGVVVLKRLSQAHADGDRVLAVIRGSAVNQDGRSGGLTAPNGPAQVAVIGRALAAAAVAPGDVGYVEAHGTGTALGDPIELQALGAALGAGRTSPLMVGSVKTNIGHLEAAAGVAGLLKALLVLQHGEIPPHLHLSQPNPHVPWSDLPLTVPTQAVPWPAAQPRRLAGVSSFGFSGTNAHVVLEAGDPPPSAAAGEGEAYLLPLSAKSPSALRELAGRYAAAVADAPLASVCYTAAIARSHFAFRMALVVRDRAEACARLGAFAAGDDAAGVVTGRAGVEDDATPGASLDELARLFCRGARIDWRALHPSPPPLVDVPTYPFERQRHWIETPAAAAEDWRDHLYDVRWTPAHEPRAAEIAAGLDAEHEGVARTHQLDHYRAVLPALDALAAEHARAALSEVGSRALPRYARLLARLREIAAAPPSAASAAELAEHFPECRTELAVLERCGRRLADVLRGECDPLSLLFPGGALEDAARLYGGSPFARALNSLVARAVALAAGGRPQRVLELGGGTASTTLQVLPSLPEGSEYVFTDVSPVFVQMAAEKLGARAACRVLDLERSPAEQGFPGGQFDLVLAANVLHATRDLRRALSHARSLLAPGGLLVLLESVTREPWIDVTFGLTDGWWHFTDEDLRLSHPLLTHERWLSLLEEEGFTAAVAPSPAPGTPAQQVVLVARAEAPSPGPWLIVGDGGGLSAALACEVESTGERCDIVSGPAWPEGRWRQVVDVRACDGGRDPVAHGRVLDEARALGDAHLWLVTHGAQPAGGSRHGIAVEQAPLWGLGRVLALEMPARWGGLIDLDPDVPAAEQAAALWAVLRDPAAEDQWVLREGRRHVPRLGRRELSRALRPPALRADATYLVTGGLGTLGRSLARHLIERGARHLVLAGRTAEPEAARPLEELGATVRVVRADVTDEAQLAALLDEIARSAPPLRGVFHAAGVMRHDAYLEIDEASWREVLRPKVQGALLLDRLTRGLRLEWFVLFSSASSVWGSRGGAHYAAANALLDALAHRRRAEGLPALSLNLGRLSERGMLSERDAERLGDLGLTPLNVAAAWTALAHLTAAGLPQATIASIDWSVFRPFYELQRRRRLFAGLSARDGSPAAARRAAATADHARLRARLAEAEPDRRPSVLTEHLRELAAHVLGFAPEAFDVRKGFFEAGMDSLTVLEFKNALEASLGHSFPSAVVFKHPNVEALAGYVGRELFPELFAEAAAHAAEPPATAAADVLQAIQDLSEEEADARLRQLTGAPGER